MNERSCSGPTAARRAGITYRKLDYWCREGVLGEEHQVPAGSGHSRQLTDLDVAALQAIGRVSEALAEMAGQVRNLGSVKLYRVVADQVRAGATVVQVRLGDHVELTIDIADLVASADEGAVA